MKQKLKREVLILLAVFASLLLVSLLVSRSSLNFHDGRELLFKPSDISDWDEISVSGIVLGIDGNDVVEKNLRLELERDHWEQVKRDLQSLFIIEDNIKIPPSSLVDLMQSEAKLSIVTHNQKVVYRFGPLLKTTGNFWVERTIQNDVHYYLCESDLAFDAFYKNELEGKHLSYYQWLNYFQKPFAQWLGKYFWKDLDSITFKTAKNILFKIDRNLKIEPALAPEVEMDKAAIEEYLAKWMNFIPEKVTTVTQDPTATLIFEIEVAGEKVELWVVDEGFYQKNKKWMLHISASEKEQLVVLRERFMGKKILPLAKIWESGVGSFIWTVGKFSTTHQVSEIKKDPSWVEFFCLMANCSAVESKSYLKVAHLNSQEAAVWRKSASRRLSLANEYFDFKQAPYKLEILCSSGTKLTYITNKKNFFPK